MPATPLPLNGLKVLDLTAHRSGPTAVRFLADWGAEVIKIEEPGAGVDATGSHRETPDMQNLHRNKRSMTLNLKSPEGLKVFLDMAKTADIVVENYKSSTKVRLGVDYESVKKINPRIIYGSISGFGQDGPYRDRGGVDQIIQGMGGLMSVTGTPESGPMRVGIAINDTAAGTLLANAILMALYDRERTGQGQWVCTSLMETQIFFMDFQAAAYLVAGKVPGFAGNNHPNAAATGTYKTADGYINISAPGERLWERFCKAIDARDILENPDFATNPLRVKNKNKLRDRLNALFLTRDSQHWIEALNKVGAPCGPINSVDQVFADPQVQHLGIARPVDHPRLGPMKLVGNPIHMSRYAQPEKLGYTPDTGEHTDEVLADYGYDKAAIAQLRAKGAL